MTPGPPQVGLLACQGQDSTVSCLCRALTVLISDSRGKGLLSDLMAVGVWGGGSQESRTLTIYCHLEQTITCTCNNLTSWVQMGTTPAMHCQLFIFLHHCYALSRHILPIVLPLQLANIACTAKLTTCCEYVSLVITSRASHCALLLSADSFARKCIIDTKDGHLNAQAFSETIDVTVPFIPPCFYGWKILLSWAVPLQPLNCFIVRSINGLCNNL